MIRVLLAPTLQLAQDGQFDVTIEAEYGSHVVEGTLFTAAHHQPSGPYMGRHLVGGTAPSPCNNPNIPVLESGDILLSHMDLDSLGGALRACPVAHELFAPQFQSFWDLAEAVDTRGAHKLGVIKPSFKDEARLYAFWAWSKEQPRHSNSALTDITLSVVKGLTALKSILANSPSMIEAGQDFLEASLTLNANTFRCVREKVVFRVTPKDFVNHMYNTNEGHIARAVVAFNEETKAVTLSFADPEWVKARDLVQKLWGSEAGGHNLIAGSPRGKEMTIKDAEKLIEEVNEVL
jgi:hypothetical protein